MSQIFRQKTFSDERISLLEIDACVRILEPLVVHHESFDEEFLEAGRRPTAELHTARGADPVPNGENGVEIVKLDFTAHLAITLVLNCCIFCNSCLPSYFTILEDVL